MGKITLLTGGGRSGKSSYALTLAQDYKQKAFIATAEPFDEEMRQRINRHKLERDKSFLTIEEPLNLDKALRLVPKETGVAIIDCLAVWVGNLMHYQEGDCLNSPIFDAFIKELQTPMCHLIIVTNEVGLGIIPDNESARQYRDLLGLINQKIAALAESVILMVSGIPLILKQ